MTTGTLAGVALAAFGAVAFSQVPLADAPNAGGTPPTRNQERSFRTSVDLVGVDVQVIDARGEPITALSRDMFEVAIDGRRRPVVSADFVHVSQSPALDLRNVPSEAVGFNEATADGTPVRTFILVIDVGSFIGGEASPVVDVARSFVNGLPPGDRIGIITLPTLTAPVDPTTDRAAVRRALAATAGVGQQLGGEFHLSESEIVDITAEALSILASGNRFGTARGAQSPFGSDALQRVQARECRVPADARCLEAIVGEATALFQYFEQRATATIAGIRLTLARLGTHAGRKTVIVLSAGLAVSDRSGGRVDVAEEARNIATDAARAEATIYALQFDLSGFRSYSTASRRIRDASSGSRDQRIASRLLDQIAESAGGAHLSAQNDSGLAALGRVLRETAAYYVLAVEPQEMPRDDRSHRLSVKVNVRGATVRSRQWLVLPRAGRR
jgi:VWFA-related protein